MQHIKDDSIREDINTNDIKSQVNTDVSESREQMILSLTNQVKELNEKFLRQLAECENIRIRSAKLIQEGKDYAIFNFVKDLVPVMDHLSIALKHLSSQEVMNNNEMETVFQGFKMTKNELESVFSNHGLQLIEPQSGNKFDYRFHHAISQVNTNEYKENSIVSTMQVGYKIKDRLVRPAKVIVAKNS
jgi:molecular chaperone GrpE